MSKKLKQKDGTPPSVVVQDMTSTPYGSIQFPKPPNQSSTHLQVPQSRTRQVSTESSRADTIEIDTPPELITIDFYITMCKFDQLENGPKKEFYLDQRVWPITASVENTIEGFCTYEFMTKFKKIFKNNFSPNKSLGPTLTGFNINNPETLKIIQTKTIRYFDFNPQHRPAINTSIEIKKDPKTNKYQIIAIFYPILITFNTTIPKKIE